MKYTVTLEKVVEEYNLLQINPTVLLNTKGKEKVIPSSDVNRLSIQLTGFIDYFDAARIQLIGKVESTYLSQMNPGDALRNMKNIFNLGIPCVVFCRGEMPAGDIIEAATRADIPLFSTVMETSEIASDMIRWLRVQLAPRVTVHAVFVDIYGEGVLILGESGIGKSETALELIRRGHRFIADDAVEIKKVSSETLIGSSPDIIRHLIELRGIGVIDIHQMFGVESIMMTQSVDLIIKITDWDKMGSYDRLGLVEEYYEILGNKVVCHTIPIRSGRNLAVICEAAAVNHRQKKMGYNAAEELEERLVGGVTKIRKLPKLTSLPRKNAKKVGTITANFLDSRTRPSPFE